MQLPSYTNLLADNAPLDETLLAQYAEKLKAVGVKYLGFEAPKIYGTMEMQPLQARTPPACIDTQKSITKISNVESSSRKYEDDVSNLRVCHAFYISSPVLVVRKKVENQTDRIKASVFVNATLYVRALLHVKLGGRSNEPGRKFL